MRIVSTRITFLLLFVIIPLHLSGQEKLKGNKIVVTEDRNISDFNKIDIKDKIEVIINQGNNKSVLVETDENIQFAVLTEVKDNTLYIQLSKKIIKKKTLKVYVSVDDFINEISTNGYANVRSDGTLNLDQITINASGDSKISMDIKCSNFTLLNNKVQIYIYPLIPIKPLLMGIIRVRQN